MNIKNFVPVGFIAALAMTGSLSAYAHDGDHAYVNGICSIEGCTDKYQAPTQGADGYFQVVNAGNVEWISDYVQNENNAPNVKMMNDIDFTGVSHTMIGQNDARKFNGIWDGQGYRIKNLVLNYGSNDTPTAIGFFAWVRGGTTIKNLIMDESCYFEGKVRVAAFVGVTQVASGGAVRIENCVNEAKVQGHTGATGGFIGCRNPNNQDTPQAIISGCANHGDILCDANEAAAFVGWANSASDKHIVENSYNTGKVSVDGNGRGFIRGDNLQITNSYDFGGNSGNTQNVGYSWGTADPVASGELAFVVNQNAQKLVFYQNLGSNADAAPVPFATSAQVYAHGSYRCDGVALPGTTYDNTPGEGTIPPHSFTNGICRNDGCTKPFEAPEVDGDGWWLLANAGNVEAFTDYINGGSGSIVAKAKLTADIDFENIVNLHRPIGPSTGCKFKGEFDGQGHRIKNMIINTPDAGDGVGFFGWLQGNSATYVHDLIIDGSCSITGKNKVGALAGGSQNTGATITIENVVNEASVTGSGQDVAAIVGGETGNKATFYVHNVVNTGTITSTNENPFAGALFCYQEKGTVENFINLGTIVGHNGGNIGRFQGSWKNVVDLSNTDDKTQAVVAELTSADIASGKLAFYMNQQAEAVVFYQTIGTDAYPVPFSTSQQVYAHGTFRCDGESIGELTYDNTDSGDVIPPHNYSTDGFCQNAGCTKPNEAPETDGDGWLLLKNAGTVEWLSDKVEAEGGNYVVKAKLTADIDFGGTENLHQPIGRREGAKFKGELDGQGHRIKGMVINRPENEFQGFFGYLQGNAPGSTIRNLIIDKTCSVTALNKAAGVAGNVQNSSGTITFENVVNEADVTVSGTDAGGILGGEQNGARPTFAVRNIVNTGTITSASHGGGIFCWQGNGTAENVINLGKVVHLNGEAGHGNLGHFDAGWTNAVDVSETEFTKTDGVVDGLTLADAANGNLAYYMNMMAGSEVFFQTIGTDAYPMPFNTSAQVYGHAWDGTAATIVAANDATIALDELVIDDTWKNFYTPTTVTINIQKISYSRSNVAGFNTVCLPFALTSDMLPDNAGIFEVEELDADKVKLNKVNDVQAGEPCLVRFPADYTGKWDVTLTTGCTLAQAPTNTGVLKGSYNTQTIGEGKYKLNSTGDAFGITTAEATINPFRAYLESTSGARELTLVFDEETTAVNNVRGKIDDGRADVYDLQGRKAELSKGLNIVRLTDGTVKKVLVK